jgi:beta-galactosidase
MIQKQLHRFLGAFAGFAVVSTAWAAGTPTPRNDDMYPPAENAKAAISFDGKGFIVNGRHIFLASGSLHYPRVPHELWADRLLRMKQAGFNGVQTYAFWNYHEPVENQWNFSGDGDVEQFLATAQKLGLYATVRVGPYICAEWDSGGYPVWTRFVPNLKSIRTLDPVWMSLNDHWYDKYIPIIAKHQITRGGNVILVQLENEHPRGWGVLPDDPYFVHLHDEAVKDGIEVPHFMSGMHHGGSPSPEDLDTTARKTPWYSTETWPGWFDDYRTLARKKFRSVVAANWATEAHGGDGQNYYMIHGGSNFDSWSDDSTAASYDYGAAIGQCGDLRPIYYQMKRANQFAASFPDIIGNSTSALADHKNFATGKHIEVLGARKGDSTVGDAGTIVFLRNHGTDESLATLKDGSTFRMPGDANYPLAENATIAPGVKIVSDSAPVLAVAHNDGVVTVVVYGMPGDTGHLTLAVDGDFTVGKTTAGITADHLNFTVKYPDSGIEQCIINRGGNGGDSQIRLLAVNEDLSLYTWIIGPEGRQDVIFGPAFVQKVDHASDGKTAVIIERPYGQASCGQVAVFGAKDSEWHLAAPADASIESQAAPTLGQWQMSEAKEVAADFDDSSWKQSDAPLPMGADGDNSAFAWYRTTVNLPTAGQGQLSLKGANNLEVYVNGRHLDFKGGGYTADFVAGKNTLTVFASHKGRNKMFAYLGPLDTYDIKGLQSAQLRINGQTQPILGWRLKGGAGLDRAVGWSSLVDSAGVPAFYRTTFSARPPGELGAHPILRVNYKGLSRGMIWVNGHSLGRYPEKIRVDSLYIPECWLSSDGNNTLTVFDETGQAPSEISLLVEQPASREVVRCDAPIDPATPIIVPAEFHAPEMKVINAGNLAWNCAVSAQYTTKGQDQPIDVASAGAVTDGDADTVWGPPDQKHVSSASASVDLGQSRHIKVAEIVFDSAANGYKYTLEGSTDGKTWLKLGDQSTAVPTSPDSPSELTRLNLNGDAYRYLRVTIHAGRNFNIAEIRAFAEGKA